ncbi:hypothetical protein JHK86_009754 [Glycine max]|nr:hypothetical protein JHK86_009754 [Glycine max]
MHSNFNRNHRWLIIMKNAFVDLNSCTIKKNTIEKINISMTKKRIPLQDT